MLYLTLSVFSTYDTNYLYGMVFILLALLKKGVKERIKFFDVHVIATIIIYFFKSLLHESHLQYHKYIIIYIMFTIYHEGTMHLAYSDKLCMKIHLFKITKCFARYICSYMICISKYFLKAQCTRILKCKIKNLIYFVKLWQIHKYTDEKLL